MVPYINLWIQRLKALENCLEIGMDALRGIPAIRTNYLPTYLHNIPTFLKYEVSWNLEVWVFSYELDLYAQILTPRISMFFRQKEYKFI